MDARPRCSGTNSQRRQSNSLFVLAINSVNAGGIELLHLGVCGDRSVGLISESNTEHITECAALCRATMECGYISYGPTLIQSCSPKTCFLFNQPKQKFPSHIRHPEIGTLRSCDAHLTVLNMSFRTDRRDNQIPCVR